MSTDQNVQLIQKIYSAFTRGDLPTILAQLDPNVRWDVVAAEKLPWGAGLPAHDPQGVSQFFTTLIGTVEYCEFEPVEYIAQGDRVVVLGHDERAVRANGQVINTPWIMIWTVHNGVVTSFDYFDNSSKVVAALAA